MNTFFSMIVFAGFATVACGQSLASRMYADRTARSVGDLVTVLIEEQSSVSQGASNDRSKSRKDSLSMSVPSPTLGANNFWKAFTLPEWSLNADKNFGASAKKDATDSLSASITVYITEVLPNGYLMISGDRVVNIDGDLLQFTLTGMVRPDDVSRANSVLSSRIAGASITYKTTGEFSRSSKKSFLSKAIDWVVPF